MEIPTLVNVLDQPHLAADHLHGWGLRDVRRGQQTLVELAETGLTLDILAAVCKQLSVHLPKTPDPDAALDAFRRYLFAVRSPLALAALFERDETAIGMLLGALSLGPRWADMLARDPEAFDLLRLTAGQSIVAEALRHEIRAETEAFHDERQIAAALARTYERHALRIAYGEMMCDNGIETVMEGLAQLAEAVVEAALAAALRKADEVRPLPAAAKATLCRCAVIALGNLGGSQPSYSQSLSFFVVYDMATADTAMLRAVHDRFERVARALARLVGEATGDVARLLGLPDSPLAAAAHAAEDVVVGFDSFGRTWHRQEMLKARPVAGDRRLGDEVLTRLQTWLFRRYLNRADESGIKALKRRILLEATLHQDDSNDVRVGRGALRDIESTVEFLQLLAGGDQPQVRRQGTLAALAGLEAAGTISTEEHNTLHDGFLFLRRLEHRLQIQVGPKATELAGQAVLERIASGLAEVRDANSLCSALKCRLDATWQTIVKLLSSAFPHEPPTPREVDLLLNPSPPSEEIRAALAPFGFQHAERALATLNDLAAERVPFLSTRRCRHLLTTILPQLLCAVGMTPSPDHTLDNLARVSNSLGGKGVLWDLFHASPPTLDLYVKLCAASPYLSDILTTNPGMIDELVDSLQLNRLQTRDDLNAMLAELCRGAAETLSILHDFRNAEHLRIGVREMLGKEDIDRSHGALADVAETCLAHVAELEFQLLMDKFGRPTIGTSASEGEPCYFALVGLGKLGGHEPNYHSHLDVLFVYEAEGATRPGGRLRRIEPTANNHFFTQLAQRIIKQLSLHTPKGRLYSVDAQFRPIGGAGGLTATFAEFEKHFSNETTPLWQWQALCQARPVFGESTTKQGVANLIRQLLVERKPRDSDTAEIRQSRLQLERGASPHNLKRAAGGTLDVEFIAQMLQLRHAASKPAVLQTNTQAALRALSAAGALSIEMAERLGHAYRYLRRVESGICLMNASARHDLPTDEQELRQLAFLLGHSNPVRMRQECLQAMAENRAAFNALTTQR